MLSSKLMKLSYLYCCCNIIPYWLLFNQAYCSFIYALRIKYY